MTTLTPYEPATLPRVVPAGGNAAPAPGMAAVIAAHPFAKDMPRRVIERVADFAREAEFATGETILREGDPANRFYLILEGRVVVESFQGERGLVPVQTLGPGEVLGFSWLFPPYYWHFDARAVAPTRALFIYGTPLRELCEADAEVGREIYRRVATCVVERLQATRRRMYAPGGFPMPALGESPKRN